MNEDLLVQIKLDNSKFAQGMQEAADANKKAIDDMRAQIDKLKLKFDEVGKSSKKNTDETKKNFDDMGESSKAPAEKIKTSFDKIKDKFDETQNNFKKGALVIGAAMAVVASAFGAVFLMKDYVELSKQINEENLKLARGLGISATAASALRIAIGDVAGNTDEYLAINAKLNKQLKTNEEAVVKMGVVTRDSNNNLLSQEQIFQNAIKTMATYKNGTDQNLAAQQLFGMSADDSRKYVKLNSEAVDSAKEKAKQLNLVVGVEGIEAQKKYKDAMNDFNDAMEGIKVTIGQAVMPLFTKMANWFASIGPDVLNTFNGAIEFCISVVEELINIFKVLWNTVELVFGDIVSTILKGFGVSGSGVTAIQFFMNILGMLKAAIISLRIGFEISFAIIEGVLVSAGSVISNLASTAYKFFTLDFSGAIAQFKNGANEQVKIAKDYFQKITDISVKGKSDLEKALMADYKFRPQTELPAPPPGGNKDFISPADMSKAKDLEKQILEAQLALEKAKDDAAFALMKETTKNEISLLDDKYKNFSISMENYYIEKSKLINKDFDEQKAQKEKELELNNSKKTDNKVDEIKKETEKVKILGQINLLQKQRTEALTVNNRMLDDELRKKQMSLDLDRINNINKVDTSILNIKKINSDLDVALLRTTAAEKIEIDKKYEMESYNLTKKKLEAELILRKDDADAQRQIKNQLLDNELKNNEAMAALNSKSMLEQNKNSIDMLNVLKQSTQNSLFEFSQQTKSLKDIVLGFFKSIEQQMAKMASEKLMKQIFEGANGSGGIAIGGVGSSNPATSGFRGILNGLFDLFPKYDVGSNYVPQDQLAVVHQGERIMTAKENSKMSSGGGMQVVNHFNVSGQVDRRAREQIATEAARGIQRAQMRGF